MQKTKSKCSSDTFFWSSLSKDNSTTALIDSAGGITYFTLHKKLSNISNKLLKLDVKSDEPIGCLVTNQACDVINYLAIWFSGCVVVPIHEKASPRTIQNIITQTGLRIILKGSQSESWPSLLIEEKYDSDGDICLVKRRYVFPSTDLVGAALVVFTSGSTGMSKGVILSHQALNDKLNVINEVVPFAPGLSTMLVLHLTFSFGIWVSFLTLKQSGTLHMFRKFDPLIFLTYLLEREISAVAVTPTMLRMLFSKLEGQSLKDFVKKYEECRYPKLLITGGEIITPALGKKINELLPYTGKADVYGLTETCTSDFILPSNEFDAFYGTIGRPTPGVKYRITDDMGHEVEEGCVGELEINTPYIMKGYLGQKDLTRQSLHDDFFSTGDLARKLKNGMVELVGRKKELIYKGGNKISPIEIENVFLEHSDIAQCMVVSIPDKIMQERIAILIVPQEKRTLDVNQLKLWAAQRLEKNKVPDVFHLTHLIPVGPTGKASRLAAKKYIINIGVEFS